MSYQLVIDGTTVDLFPEYEISISVEVYSSEDVGELRYPFSFPTKLPYTQTNRGIFGGYDYTTEFGNLSNKAFVYVLYTNGNIVSKGTVFPKSVVVNAPEPYFECEFNDLSLEFIQGLKQLGIGDIYNSVVDTAIGDIISERYIGIYDWLTIENDYAGRSIELPYVDFDNSQEKYGYNARQFTAWGLTDRKVGLMPALNVINFIRRCFVALGYDYVSRFGYTNFAYPPTWESTHLYMLYPSRLLSETANEKLMLLKPYSDNVYKNKDQIIADNAFDLHAYNVGANYTPYRPTNYNTANSNTIYDYGTQFVYAGNPAAANAESRLGFIAYSTGFSGRIRFTGGLTSKTIDDFRVCIYSCEYFDGTYTYPYLIENINSYNDAYFTPTLVLWEAEVPKYRIPLKDVSGNILQLQPVAVQQPADPRDRVDHTGGGTHGPYNVLYFEPFTAYLDEVRDFVASNKYQISFEVEMTGFLNAEIVNKGHDPAYTYPSVDLYDDDIKKARIFDYTFTNLGIQIVNDGVFLAALPDDVFEFRLSLETANTYSPYEMFIEIINRFGLSLVYNYSDDKFYLDTMDDMRSGLNVTIDPQVDDIQLYTIYSAGLPYNKIKLLNKDFGGLYDKFPNDLAVGSYDGIFNIYGSGDYSVELNGALINPINKTVCGDILEANWDLLDRQIISENEAGFITNEIRDFDTIGLRFGYLGSPQYNTNIRYPKFMGINSDGKIVDTLTYQLLASVKMQGIMGDTGSSGTLRFADRDGNTQAFYNYYTGLERIASNTRTSMDLNAVVPVSWLTNNYQYSKIFEFSSTGEQFVIESLEGTIYGDVVYATLKIKFL
jgi:hypothetical protein